MPEAVHKLPIIAKFDGKLRRRHKPPTGGLIHNPPDMVVRCLPYRTQQATSGKIRRALLTRRADRRNLQPDPRPLPRLAQWRGRSGTPESCNGTPRCNQRACSAGEEFPGHKTVGHHRARSGSGVALCSSVLQFVSYDNLFFQLSVISPERLLRISWPGILYE
jgi:hypothetical protein